MTEPKFAKKAQSPTEPSKLPTIATGQTLAPKTKAYFDSGKLTKENTEYVAWVDIMGTKSHIKRGSINEVAIIFYKLHVAGLCAKKDIQNNNIQVYPVMDGFYATSCDALELQEFLGRVFYYSSHAFLSDKKKHIFQYLIKASVAYGKIYHGKDIEQGSADRLDENPNYKDSLILGKPVLEAFQFEKASPPFGIAVHGNARKGFGLAKKDVWWKWYGGGFKSFDFYLELEKYFDFYIENNSVYRYKIDRIVAHKALAKAYFDA
ncbi:MAG: hypothetical protein GY853_10435 [PVC group bacterium]|nr:hypothetical protein [PVC group bacterium]